MRRRRVLLKVLRTRLIDKKPLILSHLLTGRCNADCPTCLWKLPPTAKAEELSTAEVEALYLDAARNGFVSLVVWGGEPMLRDDLGRLSRTARGLGMDTTIITNGWWLEERRHEIIPWTDRIVVSVDAVGPLHDELRRCPGLFERLQRGLVRVRAEHPRLRLVLLALLSRANLGEIGAVAAFAREVGAPVVFQTMNVVDTVTADAMPMVRRESLSPDQARWAAMVIQRLRHRGYPVGDSGAYLARLGRNAFDYRCHYRKVVLRVEPNGDVLDCTGAPGPLGNVRRTDLATLLGGDRFRSFLRRAEQCHLCRDAGVVETSHMWEGRVGAFVNAVRTLG